MIAEKSQTTGKWKDVNHFRLRVDHWADQVRVKPKRVVLRRMRNKWASCSSKGFVTFNTELLDEGQDFGDYVIIHELLHLKIPNHGKLFKSLLGIYIDNYKEIVKNRSVCGVI
jgi:predicted metal-dependent hydrolase